jgi:predicted acetyltransferase
MTADIRLAADDELLAAGLAFGTALLFPPPPAARRDAWTDTFARGRTHVAVEGGRIVATAGVFEYSMTVPGGHQVPMAGVTRVGVLPTHTRRGLLSALMRAQLDDAAARGEPVATLRASEAVIYGRFGYGMANEAVDFEIARQRARFPRPDDDPLRLVSRDEAVATFPALHDRVAQWRPGNVRRPDWQHRRWVSMLTDERADEGWWFAVHDGPGGQPDGYVAYAVAEADRWHDDAGHKLRVHDLFGADPQVEAALWHHVLDLDLVGTVVADLRPFDDAVRWRATDHRAVRTTLRDEIWLRLTRVEQALASRVYGDGEPVVLAVHDALLPANTGSYEVDGDGARPTEAAASLRLDVAALGATYLGGVPFAALAAAGRVDGPPSAVRAADRLFHSPVAPWCGTFF